MRDREHAATRMLPSSATEEHIPKIILVRCCMCPRHLSRYCLLMGKSINVLIANASCVLGANDSGSKSESKTL